MIFCITGITVRCCHLQALKILQFLTCAAAGSATTPKAINYHALQVPILPPTPSHTWHAVTARLICFGSAGMRFTLAFCHNCCCHSQPAPRTLTPFLHQCASTDQQMHIWFMMPYLLCKRSHMFLAMSQVPA